MQGRYSSRSAEFILTSIPGRSKLIAQQIHDALIPMATIPAMPKAYAALAIAECDKALCEGGDEELQLLECCLRIKEAMTKA